MSGVSMEKVKELRERTGAGVLDCKRVLTECDGDVEAAVIELQKKGLAKAAKKSGRITAEGMVHAYIHPGSKVGVMVEVNCETDFVARGDDFKEFVDDVAMQIAAMSPLYVKTDDIPEADRAAQKEIFVAQAAESGKPANIVEKMIEGKLVKWAKEVCLYDQEFIRNLPGEKKTVDQLRSELVSKTGENISVRRFVRFELGEGLQKRSSDLAAEVAAEMSKYQ